MVMAALCAFFGCWFAIFSANLARWVIHGLHLPDRQGLRYAVSIAMGAALTALVVWCVQSAGRSIGWWV